MLYVNDEKYFTKNELEKRAKENGFTAMDPVEKFLWDCEIASLLQSFNDHIILKGGAAVQMHLPLNLQRASVDIDLVMDINEKEFEKVLDRIVENEVYSYDVYEPKNPNENIPLKTYFFKVPSVLYPDDGPIDIKIDAIFDSCKVPLSILTDVKTFAIDVKKIKTYKNTALIGDKLLTLGENTIGITDQSNYPKQLYDVYNLINIVEINEKIINEIISSIESVSNKEIKYRNYDGGIKDIINDVIICLKMHSEVDLSQYIGDMKKHLHGFQSMYLSSEQRNVKFYDWSKRFNQVRFLAEILLNLFEDEISATEAVKCYNKAINFHGKALSLEGQDIRNTIQHILNHADRLPYYKELRVKPIHRVFWEIATPEKIDAIIDECNL